MLCVTCNMTVGSVDLLVASIMSLSFGVGHGSLSELYPPTPDRRSCNSSQWNIWIADPGQAFLLFPHAYRSPLSWIVGTSSAGSWRQALVWELVMTMNRRLRNYPRILPLLESRVVEHYEANEYPVRISISSQQSTSCAKEHEIPSRAVIATGNTFTDVHIHEVTTQQNGPYEPG